MRCLNCRERLPVIMLAFLWRSLSEIVTNDYVINTLTSAGHNLGICKTCATPPQTKYRCLNSGGIYPVIALTFPPTLTYHYLIHDIPPAELIFSLYHTFTFVRLPATAYQSHLSMVGQMFCVSHTFIFSQ